MLFSSTKPDRPSRTANLENSDGAPRHRSFWGGYSGLSPEIRTLADKCFSLLEDNPRHHEARRPSHRETVPKGARRGRTEGLHATWHFVFGGGESYETTVVIDGPSLTVSEGLVGTPDVFVRADSRTWLKFLAKEQNIVLAIITGKIKIKGPTRLMDRFAKCFPL